MKTNLKLADDTVPFSDYGEIKSIEIINPECSDDSYVWNLYVKMNVEGGTQDQMYKVQYTIGPEMREAIIQGFQHPDLLPKGPTAQQRKEIEENYRALHPEKAQPWWKRFLSRSDR